MHFHYTDRTRSGIFLRAIQHSDYANTVTTLQSHVNLYRRTTIRASFPHTSAFTASLRVSIRMCRLYSGMLPLSVSAGSGRILLGSRASQTPQQFFVSGNRTTLVLDFGIRPMTAVVDTLVGMTTAPTMAAMAGIVMTPVAMYVPDNNGASPGSTVTNVPSCRTSSVRHANVWDTLQRTVICSLRPFVWSDT
jgi:hypothetical protein